MSSCVDQKLRPRPRPILKSLPEYSPLPFSTYPLHSPHVHFPPTPTLTSTSFTHSAIVYDRAPIIVSENICALPERGGRCYTLQPRNKQSSRHTGGHGQSGAGSGPSDVTQDYDLKGSYFHPRAFEACEPEREVDNNNDNDRYDSYFTFPGSSSDSSSSSSSSSSDSDSDSSCGSFTSPSIPRVVVKSALGNTPSTYPLDSSLCIQNGSQSRQSHSSQQQQQQFVQYACPSSMAETKPKKIASGSGRRVKSTGNRSNTKCTDAATRFARFGGGFSDQAMVLEGCLGGF